MKLRKPSQESIDRAWAVARRMPIFGFQEIAAESGLSLCTATSVVREWQVRGVVELERQGRPRVRNLYRLTRGTEAYDRPRGRSPESNMWQAMRQLRSFSLLDLVGHATTDAILVSEEVARRYCVALAEADYLEVITKAVPGRRSGVYRLKRNTGPHAPRSARVPAILDPNIGETILLGGAE